VESEPQPLAELRPDLPIELCAIIQKMMAKSPDQRYQTCADLLKDIARLREILGGRRVETAGTPLPAALTQVADGAPFLARARSGQRLATVAALTIALAFIGGGALVWLRSRTVGQTQEPMPLAGADSILTEDQKQERSLLDAALLYADPAGDRGQLNAGLDLHLRLGLFYLGHDRLDDADRFFTGLLNRSPSVEAYKTLGRLGHATVLGLQNHPRESNQAFQQLLEESRRKRNPPDRLVFLLNRPELLAEIGRALSYNKANAGPGAPFPEELENLRLPPKWAAPQPGSLGRAGRGKGA